MGLQHMRKIGKHLFPFVIRLTVSFCVSTWSLAAEPTTDFNFDIRPLLSDRCYVCHGPDEEAREADLRLDTSEGLRQEASSGDASHVISPGDLEQSELWQRITSDDPDLVMPPPDSNLSLTKPEKEVIRQWIEGGAKHKKHWSFLPFQKAGKYRNATQAIDGFVAAQQKEASFSFQPQAEQTKLLRRLRFDLTGLPPSSEETQAFTKDESPDAYEKLIDRLLASEQYGERMAADWLDVARYSDTYGYQVDRDRFVWPYRDWVIRAFNRNLPYDQFITEQLAGDLLDSASEDQILATTFNRLHPQKVEGGSVPEEFRIEYVADRTQTFSTAMLGLTFECARCHDHKYDPLSQKEYYQLTAFFDKIDEAGLYSYFTQSIPTPTLLLDRENDSRSVDELKQAAADAKEQLTKVDLANGTGEDKTTPPQPIETLDFDSFKPTGGNKLVEGVSGKAVQLSGDDGVNLKKGNFRRYEPFSVSLWLNVPDKRERVVVFHRSRAWTDAASRGYQLLLEDGKLSWSLIHFWPGNAIRVRSESELPVGEWHHVTVTYDGSSNASGLNIFLDGEPLPLEVVRNNLYREITGGGNDHITIGQRFRDIGLRNGMVDEFQIFDRELLPAEVRLVFDAKSKIDQDEAKQIALHRSDPHREKLAKLKEARKALCEKVGKYREIMVMQEMAQPRETFVLGRGAYDNRQDKVSAETPSVLPAMDETLPKNRLGLSKWMTDPTHPLTARVAVNRIWQLMFGQGLVRTPEDFGSQGQLPTHPALLDWLARDFVDSGWDIKRLMKQIAMSQTYRQSSVVPADLLERDPENTLYARAPSYRWPAEMLRDQALAVSSLLVSKVGGPPAKPYELEVSFKPIKPDEGEGLYRRSVYTFWKRTGPAPIMMALDAAKRDVCRVQRSRTASPLQTLVLMNSPQFVEAARSLANSLAASELDRDALLNSAFSTLTSRQPTEAETKILSKLYQEQLAKFEHDKDAIMQYLSVGNTKLSEDQTTPQIAALTAVVNALFGLDEVMMKR